MHAESLVVEMVGGIAALLVVAAITYVAARKLGLPFTVALVIVGIGLGQLQGSFAPLAAVADALALSPHVILFVFLPTLVFESAYNLDARQLQRNLLPVLTLAIPGLVVSTGMIGGLLMVATPLQPAESLMLGAILSATDPVAVIAIFKQLGAPRRLTILVEGESLMNDATAIVVSRIFIGIVVGGAHFTPASVFADAGHFVVVFVGGGVVGWLLGLAVSWVIGRVHEEAYIEITLTTVLAYLSFVIAEELLHVSGVMATVMAGLTLGGWGKAKISASVRVYLEHFWEYMAFVANALIFLLVGLAVNLGALVQSWDILLWVILAMLVSRATVIYGLVPFAGHLPGTEKVSRSYQTVMYWGGLRGAIALAVALSLGPSGVENADMHVALVTGAVLFTLLVQGLSIEKLVHALGLDEPPLADRVGRAEGLLSAKRRALERMPELQSGGLFSARVADALMEQLDTEIGNVRDELQKLRSVELDPDQERWLLYARCFAAEKIIYYEQFSRGHLSEASYRDLCHSVDVQSEAVRHDTVMPTHTLHGTGSSVVFQAIRESFGETLALLLPRLAEKLRHVHITDDYEQAWGRYQGSQRILNELEELALAESTPDEIVAEVRSQYDRWLKTAGGRLDATAEQFPEFVAFMQERLAGRLVLNAESEIVESEARAGAIPETVAEEMIEEFHSQIRTLKSANHEHLIVDPGELLRTVPFFASTSPAEFSEMTKWLRSRSVPGGEVIIRQGAKGESLFLIARGVVRVSREIDGVTQDLGTLIAGDFFGEMALLHHAPRTANCRAVTPCAIYELRRADFDQVIDLCPELKMALETADRERARELV
jgi:CPA1 family monovalent cation:H+ antiporter